MAQLNTELWNEIEDKVGDITDLKITSIDNQQFHFKLSYKSNGILKEDYFNDLKTIITSIYYVGELISPIKKYTQSCSNPQHSL